MFGGFCFVKTIPVWTFETDSTVSPNRDGKTEFEHGLFSEGAHMMESKTATNGRGHQRVTQGRRYAVRTSLWFARRRCSVNNDHLRQVGLD